MTSPASGGPGDAAAAAPPSRTYALLGGSALILQTVFIREFLALFHSSELFAGAVLGVWLVFVGAGSALGEYASRRIAPARALAALYAALGVLSVGSAPLVRWLPGAMGVPPGTLPPITSAVGIAATAMLLPCLFVGASFSLTAAVRGDGARVYMWDAVGGLGGGLGATALIVLFAPGAMLVCSILAIAFGFLAWRWGRACTGRLWQAPGIAVGTLAVSLLVSWPARATFEKGTLRRVFEPETICAWAETSEGRWVITLVGEGTRNLYVGGALAWSEVDQSAVEEFAALAALAHPDPRRVLVLASPADPLPFTLGTACPGAEVRAVISHTGGLADRLRPERRDNVVFVERDARAYLASAAGRGERADIIACQPGLPQSFASSRLVSREAFADMAAALEPGGVLALRLPFATSYQNEGVRKVLASVVRSLGARFAHVRMEPLPHAGVVVLASAGPLAGVNEITKRYHARGARTRTFCPRPSGTRRASPDRCTARKAGSRGSNRGRRGRASCSLRSSRSRASSPRGPEGRGEPAAGWRSPPARPGCSSRSPSSAPTR
ncbi:MAG: spermidine synthase family protein [Planctomycetota bacterium]